MKMQLLGAVVLIFCVSFVLAKVHPRTILAVDTGEIKSCKYNNLTSCKTFNDHENSVLSVAVGGEFLYIGLMWGEIRRCPVSKPGNCTKFHQLDNDPHALLVFEKYIYAASDGGIVRCGLHKIEPCSTWYDRNVSITSLAAFGEYLYAGSGHDILRCPLENPEDCEKYHKTTSEVNTLFATWEHLYVGLEEGAVLSCDLNDEDVRCETQFETNSTAVRKLEFFNDELRVVLDTGDIVHYRNKTGELESLSVNDTVAVIDMITVFATSAIHKHYLGESKGCAWQPRSRCPPYIIYYDLESRDQFALHVKDNQLYNSQGMLLRADNMFGGHTGGNIFVMDAAGRIYTSAVSPVFLIHHSSLMRGQPVAAAGELVVVDGIIKHASSCSGHYRQKVDYVKQLRTALAKQGYTREFEVKDCNFMRLMIDLDFNKTDLYYQRKYEQYSLKMKTRVPS